MDILNFFAVVDRARIDKGLSKATFYEMCNISSSAASQWRKGKTLPAKTTLTRMAEVLDLDASELISYIYPGEETKKDPDDPKIARVMSLIQKMQALSPENLAKVEEYIMLLAMKEEGK